MKTYRLEHYRANKDQYYDRNKLTIAKLQEIIARYKEANPCVRCGVQYPGEPWLLEFDHRDPTDKESIVSRLTRMGSAKRLLTEMDKCDLLCVICHRRRTAIQMGWTSKYPGP